MTQPKTRAEGMTLIEVMVVVVIMAMMAAAVGMNVLGAIEEARKDDAVTRARTIQSAAVAYRLDHARGCPDVSSLADGDFLDSTTDHRDPWGSAYTIECEGTRIHVGSAGPDGAPGTEDDLGF